MESVWITVQSPLVFLLWFCTFEVEKVENITYRWGTGGEYAMLLVHVDGTQGVSYKCFHRSVFIGDI
jgi:hypothetical protein